MGGREIASFLTPRHPVSVRVSSFKPLMDSTIDKWNTKTRLASNRGDKNFKALDRRILDQIEEVRGSLQGLSGVCFWRVAPRRSLQSPPPLSHQSCPFPARTHITPLDCRRPRASGEAHTADAQPAVPRHAVAHVSADVAATEAAVLGIGSEHSTLWQTREKSGGSVIM